MSRGVASDGVMRSKRLGRSAGCQRTSPHDAQHEDVRLRARTLDDLDAVRHQIVAAARAEIAGIERRDAVAGVGLQSARISVTTPSPSIVLVRTPYDQNWHASVDGEPAQVLPADYVAQGIPVPAGNHTIVLSYTDPSIGYGLAGTAAAIGALLAAAITFGLRARKTHRRS